MPKRTVWLCLLAGAVVCGVGGAFAQQASQQSGELARVTVTGMGLDKDDATRDAMRKAVENAAGTYIYSQSQTENFVLIRDTILTRSAGFVQEHKILSASQTADGVWEVKLQAVVSINGIQDTWGVVKNLLQRMGRPRIMVFVSEAIDAAPQADSTVQTRIEHLLLESGFLLVNREQIEAIAKKDLDAAVAEDNPAKMQAIAKQFGAQLFISGSTSAVAGSDREVYGVAMHRYGADGDVKCYRSDTAQLLASQNETAYSVDRMPRVAAKKSLTALGEKLAPKVQYDILRFWQDVMEGRGELVLEVEGIAFKQYLQLKKQLEQVKGVKDITASYANSVARCAIQSDLRAEALAERLVQAIEHLEITDVSQNVIKAKFAE